MPFSELHQMTKGKLESIQPKMPNCSTDLSFGSDNEFVELLWENGQLVMQGQSSRARKSSLMSTFPPRNPKFQEKDSDDAVIPDMGRKNGKQESVLNDFSTSGPSGHVGLEHDDDVVPWLNCHIDDYCSVFFDELSGANMNPPLVARKNTGLINRSSSSGLVVRDSHEFSAKGNLNLGNGNTAKFVGGCSEPIRYRSNQSFPSLQQWRPSSAKEKSKVSDLVTDGNNTANPTQQSHFGNWSQMPISASEMLNRKTQKKDSPSAKPLQPNSSAGLMNFSHFSRPVALVKANLQNIGAAAAGSSAIVNLRGDDEAFVTGSSPMEASVVESTSGLKSAAGVPKVDLESSCKPLPEPVSVDRSEAICHQDTLMNSSNKSPDFQCQSSSAAATVALDRREGEKAYVSALASSSVCSGSSDPKHGMKRKNRDAEESDFQSEDVEDESVDVKKSTKGSKRSRAAEVHNLSERRRRDRINEKMRALQELIPNCNKADKASMLDEAIEYLKNLQLQVQIMSIGSGLCMPPMMLPAGMQQIRTPHMAHFSPMGTGMGIGMGMGYGMGMIDMGCSSGYPLIPMPPMHGPQFPCSPISRAPNFLGMPRSSLQMFGMPGQGLPPSLPCAPYIPLSGFSTAAVSAPATVMAACSMPGPDPSLPSSSKEHIQDINLQSTSKMSNRCSQIQTSMQVTEECFERCDMVQGDNQSLHVNDSQKEDTIQRKN